jgi:hypothetical protein
VEGLSLHHFPDGREGTRARRLIEDRAY